MSAITFAVITTIITRAMQFGTYDKMIDEAVKIYSGHFQIHKRGFHENKTLQYSFVVSDNILDMIKEQRHIVNFAKRIEAGGLASVGENTNGVIIIGIDPEAESQLTTIKDKIKKGNFLSSSSYHGTLVGETLAKNLDAGIGDDLILMTQGYDGSLGADIYTIEGIYSTGVHELDRNAVVLSLMDAQYLLSMGDRVSEVAVTVDDQKNLNTVLTSLRSHLDSDNFEVIGWDELLPDMVQLIAFDYAGGTIFIIILLMVVGFGILNTILMAVLERVREFGIMISLGMKPREVVGLIFIESLLMSIVALLAGCIIGGLAGLYLVHNPLTLPGEASLAFEEVGFTAKLYSKLTFSMFAEVTFIIFIITLVVTIYPAVKAARFKPVEALRYT